MCVYVYVRALAGVRVQGRMKNEILFSVKGGGGKQFPSKMINVECSLNNIFKDC